MNVYEKIEEYLGEAWQMVKIEGLPAVIMKGSEGTVRTQIKRKLKKPDDIQSIERVTPGEMKKYFRELASGGGEEKEKEVSEGRFVKGFHVTLAGRGGHSLDNQFVKSQREIIKVLTEWAKTGFADGDTISIKKGESEF